MCFRVAMAALALAAIGTAATAQDKQTAILLNGGSWFGPAQMPAQMPDKNVLIDMVINVTASGRVGKCRAAEPGAFPALEAHACTVAKERMRFTPASRNGTPVSDTVRNCLTIKPPAATATVGRCEGQGQPGGRDIDY